MSNKKATKRALLTSITALAMCVVMLVGTTFAWFTDTATANVNKIQAGKLDVALEMFDTAQNTWVTAEGKTLEFKKADAAPSGEKVLWEPGATYELPKLRVVNNGNLNIKCRVEVTGIKKVTTAATPAGTFDLNDVIAWTATGLDLDTNFIMESTDDAKEFTISGTMDTAAGNDYQGLTIDGVSITVYATQAEGEFDSNRDDYDKDATYTRTNATVIDETTGKTVTLEKGKNYTVGTATITVSDSGDITYVNNGSSGQKVTINTDGGNLTVNAANDTVYHYGRVGIVEVTAVAGDSYHEFGNASVLAIATGRAVIEKADAIKVLQVTGNDAIIAVPQNVVVDTKLEKAAGVDTIVINTIDNNGAVVNKTTITGNFATTTKGENESAATPNELSNIITDGIAKVETAKEYAAMIGSTGYASLADAVAAAEDGDTITLLKDAEGAGLKVNGKNIAIDFGGHTYAANVLVGSSGSENQAAQLLKGSTVAMKNGTLKVADSVASKAKILIQNYCDLTVNNMVLDGRNLLLASQQPVTLSNNDNVVKFTDCTVYAAERDNAIAVDAAIWGDYAGADVTLTNCTVYGKLDVAKYAYDKNAKIWYKEKDLAAKTDGTPCLTVIGGGYTDLSGAILAAQSGTTIKLAADAAGSGLASLDGSKTSVVRDSLTIDFAGHTYTMVNPAVGSKGTETQAMHWGTSLSNITMKNGTFKVADSATEVAMAMQNYINFTAEGMTFDFTGISVAHYAADEFTGANAIFNGRECPMFNNNGGNVVLTNCVVTLPEASEFGSIISGKMELNDTTFNGYVGFNDIDGTVIVSGTSSIKGGEVKDYFDNLTIVNNSGTWTATKRA